MDHPQYWRFSFLWFVLSIILVLFFTGLTFYMTAILLVSLLISFWSSSSEPQSAFQVWDHLTIDGAQYFGSSRILFSAPTFSHFVNSTIYLSCKSSNLFLAFIFVWHHLRIVIVGFTKAQENMQGESSVFRLVLWSLEDHWFKALNGQ